MSKTAITSPELTPPFGPFCQAIQVNGSADKSPKTQPLAGWSREALWPRRSGSSRISRAVLKAAGKSFDDVVRAGVFLTSMSDFAAMNGIYAKYFSQPFPARTTIGAAALPLGACVEIDLVVKA